MGFLLVASYFFIVSMLSAYLSIKVRNTELPTHITLIGSTLIGLGWMMTVKYSKLPLISMGSLVDVSAAFGFYFGLLLLGEPIKPLQYLGAALMLIGLYLINK